MSFYVIIVFCALNLPKADTTFKQSYIYILHLFKEKLKIGNIGNRGSCKKSWTVKGCSVCGCRSGIVKGDHYWAIVS